LGIGLSKILTPVLPVKGVFMSQIQDYTAEEVNTLAQTPLMVGMMVVGASLSGPFGIVKELLAALRATKEAAQQAPESSILRTLFSEEHMKAQHEQMAREKPETVDTATQLNKIRQAIRILSTKGDATEVTAYKALLVSAAESTANAAKEGGFLGIGGQRISDEERVVIEKIRSLVENLA
jgi:hypothetical protein